MPVYTRSTTTVEQTSSEDASTTEQSATSMSTEVTEKTDSTQSRESSQPPQRDTTRSPPQDPPQPPPQDTPQPIQPPVTRTSKSKSIKTTSSRRALRLAQAREEALKIKLDLAQARIAAIEAEESEDDDDTTVLSIGTQEQRVGEWLEASTRHVLAIADTPHNQEEPEAVPPQQHSPLRAPHRAGHFPAGATAERRGTDAIPSTDATAARPLREAIPSTGATAARPLRDAIPSTGATAARLVGDTIPTPDATAVRRGDAHFPANGNYAPLDAEAPTYLPARPVFNQYEEIERMTQPRQYPQADTTVNNATIATSQQSVNISELASAIAIAARVGHRDFSRYHIELPPYNGSHQDWLSFRAAYYESAATYSDIDNVARLRRCLKGRAKESVENLLMYGAHAADIMKTLESRFGRPDSIAIAELERLRTLPRLTDGPRDICVFASRVANTVATLKTLNRAQYLFSPETMKSMLEKLTPSQRYRWFDYAATHQSDEPDLLKMATYLQREADYCAPYAQPENVDITVSHTRRTQKTFVTTEKPANKCPCCSATEHYIDKCPKFEAEEIDARWKIAKAQRLCFRCLRFRHKTHNCKRVKCDKDGCEHFHHQLLHYKKKEDRSEAVTNTWLPPKETRAYLKILPIQVCGPAGVINTHALLDDGSTVTLVDEKIAEEAGLDGPTEPLLIEAINEKKIDASRSRRVKLNLRGVNQTHQIYARTIEALHLSPQTIRNEDLISCEHLRDLETHLKYQSAKPRVLIGQDNWQLLVADEIRRGRQHQPVASLTPLGWVLHGTHTRIIGRQVYTINHVNTNNNEDMDRQLSEYFALENLLVEPKRPQTDPESKALRKLEESTTINSDGYYQTALPWKSEDVTFPDNYENTLKRLQNIEKKLERDGRFKQRYHEEMNALITKGYAELAPPQKEKRVWYLPHFAVLNPMKPDKVRIVHDAAAKTRGVSLNDRLLTGPDLLQSLPGVLMRFRQHPVAVGADIREMFMQIKIKKEDRDTLRYLWRDRIEDEPKEYRMTSLIFGATCSPSIAIYIKNKNAMKHNDTHPDAVTSIIRNHYVDDFLQSFKNEEEAVRIAEDVRRIHSEAHYELRQWTSNSTQVLEAIDREPTRPKDVELSKNERVLGQVWRPSTDVIAFNLDLTRLPSGILEVQRPTKRQVLKIMMSVFDPLGLASPVTINAKKILQEVWRRGTEWDNELDDDLAKRWVEWTVHLRALRHVAIPRCYPQYTGAMTRELHVFVDASETAYTCALYWRVINTDAQVHVSLIAAKAKVAPLKITSIPRLELQAAVMGSRMATATIEEHDDKPDKRIFWTDSRTVLSWLRTGARTYRPFVAHRIAAIEENCHINEWRWVPTKHNVADEATREVPPDFNCHHRWFNGPEFLYNDPSTWPIEPQQPHSDNTSEQKVNIVNVNSDNRLYKCLPSPERFSKWERLVRTIARVLEFIDLCRPRRARTHYKRTRKNHQEDPDWSKRNKREVPKTSSRNLQVGTKYRVLEATYLREAERIIVRASQREAFKDDILNLEDNKPPTAQSRLRPLAVELLNGIIVLKTRINAATDIEAIEKRPPVLDGNHSAVKLYIDYVHRQMQHSGVEATINECKQRYCILRLRPVAKMTLHRCLPCRIRRAVPSVPPTGDHPRSRLAHHERPFTYTGLDYFGPLTVTIGRGTQKRYIALFTCLTVRAVHLEVVPSLSGDSAVMALRRMIARRGCPNEIWSDNGTNFHAANKELRGAFDEATQEEAAKRMIKWRFIPPSAPFMGGAWERMVRAVKTSINAVLTERHPTEETLATLMTEAEYTVNSRPLTYVPVDPHDPEVLTPNHFLLGGSARVPTPGTFDDSVLVGRNTWRTSQRLADHFWGRWLKEYLPTLQYRREPYGRGPALKVDDLVIIADGTLPRNTWPRGRVITVYPGPDGVVRAVDVKTKGGVLRRPTKKLIVLPVETDRAA